MRKGIKAGVTARAVSVLRQLLRARGVLALRAAAGAWRQPVTTVAYLGTMEKDAVPDPTGLVYADDLVGRGADSSLIRHTAETNHAKPIIEKFERGISATDVGWTLMEVDVEDGFALSLVFDTFEQAAAAYEGLVAMGADQGLLVMKARSGTPAARAGLMAGDYITHINGNEVTTRSEVADVFELAAPGSLVEVEGMWLASAVEVDDPDIKVFTPLKQSVRVPTRGEAGGLRTERRAA